MLQRLEWHVVQVRPKPRTTAQRHRDKGNASFLPTYLVKRSWSDRVKVFEHPLFLSYLFCRLEARVRPIFPTTPGVLSIIRTGKTPIPIPKAKIGALSRIVNSSAAAEPRTILGLWR
jgi:hypothetical protein